MPPKPFTREQRVAAFWKKVINTDSAPDFDHTLSPCWLWTGCRGSNGYGQFIVAGRRKAKAHRFAYELLIGPIPAGLDIDHLCRVRHCVNPSHLEPTTRSTNLRRGAQSALRPNCPQGHRYDIANTRYLPNGNRYCASCLQERARRHRAKLKRF